MWEVYQHLFKGPERISDVLKWQIVNTALHNALHGKGGSANACSTCNDLRNLQDTGRYCADWSFKALGSLWNMTVNTIHKHGSEWQAWRHSETMDINDTQYDNSTEHHDADDADSYINQMQFTEGLDTSDCSQE